MERCVVVWIHDQTCSRYVAGRRDIQARAYGQRRARATTHPECNQAAAQAKCASMCQGARPYQQRRLARSCSGHTGHAVHGPQPRVQPGGGRGKVC
eukprot:scaffold2735_cov58-Phaeocystis_antarctica.AAC.5